MFTVYCTNINPCNTKQVPYHILEFLHGIRAIIFINAIANGLPSKTKSHYSILPPMYQPHFNQIRHLLASQVLPSASCTTSQMLANHWN